MALAGDEYEGPSSTVSVSNGSGLFSLAAPCLGKGLAQKGTDLYLKWKAVFKGMLPPLITPPILNPSHALVKISARRERHGPYESHQGCDLLKTPNLLPSQPLTSHDGMLLVKQ